MFFGVRPFPQKWGVLMEPLTEWYQRGWIILGAVFSVTVATRRWVMWGRGGGGTCLFNPRTLLSL